MPSALYPCKPGGPNDYVYVFCSRANPEHWRRLMKVIGREDLIGDARYDTQDARSQRAAEVDEIIAAWTREHSKEDAMKLIGAAGVPAGAVFDTVELMNEPSLAERGIMQTIEHPTTGKVKMPAWPVRFDGAPAKVKPSPLLGQHNAEVLGAWLGMAAQEVDALKAEGIIGADGQPLTPSLSRKRGEGGLSTERRATLASLAGTVLRLHGDAVHMTGQDAPATANAAMQRYWNEVAGPRWVGRQEAQEARNVEMRGAASRRRPRRQPGERVLDIGVGTGVDDGALCRRRSGPPGMSPASTSRGRCSMRRGGGLRRTG